MKTQFIVQEHDKEKRSDFYDYVMQNYDINEQYPFEKEKFVASNFPFVIDFKDNIFWVCESVTCCAAAAANKAIITIDEFKKTLTK